GRTAGNMWACIHPKQVNGEQINKSYSLQLALIILPQGAELCFCVGAGYASFKDDADRARNEQALTAGRERLSALSAETIGLLEKSLRPKWFFRKTWMLNLQPVQDFRGLIDWLAYAASADGASASISRYFSVSEVKATGGDIARLFLEASKLFQP